MSHDCQCDRWQGQPEKWSNTRDAAELTSELLQHTSFGNCWRKDGLLIVQTDGR